MISGSHGENVHLTLQELSYIRSRINGATWQDLDRKIAEAQRKLMDKETKVEY